MTDHDPERLAEGLARDEAGKADADLDRLVARSLAASERGSRVVPASPSRSPWPWLIASLLLALLLGMIANPWFERQMRGALPSEFRETAPAAMPVPEPDLSSWNARMAAIESAVREQQAALSESSANATGQETATLPTADLSGLAGRIVALETVAVRLQSVDAATTDRLDRLIADVASIAGGSQAQQEQVRELLLVTAVRRLFERGRALGPLMPVIETRFGARDPDAVEALSAWNSAPVTRQSLATRLDTSLDLAPAAASEGWWQSLKRRLGGLIQVREAGSGPEAAVLMLAREALLSGDLEMAIARMAAGPASNDGNVWLLDARRLQGAETALERMELAATDGLVQLAAPQPQSPSATSENALPVTDQTAN